MKIISWNVAGLRARLKNNDSNTSFLEQCLFCQVNPNKEGYEYFDIVCLQETKCTEDQVKLPCEIDIRYPYRFWNSSDGTTQRKGFSGTTIWSNEKPIQKLDTPDFDHEGRIIALEFEKFILINVYVPNSQAFENERYKFREEWNIKFGLYIRELQIKLHKELIICGDMNVAHLDIDIYNPKSKKNKVPGFFDNERVDFAYLIETYNLIDILRDRNPTKQMSTYWSNFQKAARRKDNGWRIDYFLISKDLYEKDFVKDIKILMEIIGSDHCPLCLEI
tara:strand:- start:1247 stop:2077 length:831 start_codon:yes stop_codon:yes gene_type:complete